MYQGEGHPQGGICPEADVADVGSMDSPTLGAISSSTPLSFLFGYLIGLFIDPSRLSGALD